MRAAIILLAMLPLAGCMTAKAEYASPSGGKVNQATLKVAASRCNERYSHLAASEDYLYGPYGDYDALVDDAKACMLRQGVRVTGFRQKDGRLTAYPNQPKWTEY